MRESATRRVENNKLSDCAKHLRKSRNNAQVNVSSGEINQRNSAFDTAVDAADYSIRFSSGIIGSFRTRTVVAA